MIEQTTLHSRTSQYGSMSRGMRFMLPELRAKMRESLDEIRSGRFAREWAAEQEAGCPTLETLREAARSLPLYQLEHQLRQAMGRDTSLPTSFAPERDTPPPMSSGAPSDSGLLARGRAWLRSLSGRSRHESEAKAPAEALATSQVEPVLRAFLACAIQDRALQAFAEENSLTTHYVLAAPETEFYLRFEGGTVSGAMGSPPDPAQVRIQTEAGVLDGMLTGRINAMRAAMTGKLVFSGETRLAMRVQRIQGDLSRLYTLAREEIVSR
jgi:putative sterol carrier protein